MDEATESAPSTAASSSNRDRMEVDAVGSSTSASPAAVAEPSAVVSASVIFVPTAPVAMDTSSEDEQLLLYSQLDVNAKRVVDRLEAVDVKLNRRISPKQLRKALPGIAAAGAKLKKGLWEQLRKYYGTSVVTAKFILNKRVKPAM